MRQTHRMADSLHKLLLKTSKRLTLAVWLLPFLLLIEPILRGLNQRPNDYKPLSVDNFPTECLLYFAFVGIAHLIIFALGYVVLVLAAAVSRNQSQFLARRIGRFALFNTILLVIGSFFNGLWSCLIWGNFYFSHDYVFDFISFWPITNGIINNSFGQAQLFGISLFELQMIWLAFALWTWLLTFRLYKFVRQKREPSQPTLSSEHWVNAR